MSGILDLLKTLARLDSVTLWLAAVLFGLALTAWERTRRWARGYFLALFAALWLLSTPAFAMWLVSIFDGGYAPIRRPGDARGAHTVVLLGGGANTYHFGGVSLNEPSYGTALRVVEGARLYKLMSAPMIVLSGGVATKIDKEAGPESEAMRDAILRLGVPADHLVIEARSRTTREQALAVRQIFEGREREPFVLVTSPMHMPRSMAVFRSLGLNPVASPAPLKSDSGGGLWWWLPTDWGLMVSDTLTYDLAARIYYWIRGWQ